MGILFCSLIPFWKELWGHAVVVRPLAGYMIVITVRWCALEYQSDILLANHGLCCSINFTVDGEVIFSPKILAGLRSINFQVLVTYWGLI